MAYGEYGPAIGVYAFGMALWEMLHRSTPFSEIPFSAGLFETAIGGQRPVVDAPNTNGHNMYVYVSVGGAYRAWLYNRKLCEITRWSNTGSNQRYWHLASGTVY
jgi:hypothetical protein